MDENLLRFNFNDKIFISFDFECESLNLRYAKPWQLYFFIAKGKEILETHNFYIKWKNLKVSEGAAKVTGFNPTIIEKEGQDPSKVLDYFDSYLYNSKYFIVGANILNYDCMIHNGWRLNLNKKTDYSWLARLYDTNALAKQYKLKLKKPPDINLFEWQIKLNNYRAKGTKTSVAVLAKEFDIPHNPLTLHQANNDVPITYQIFQKLIWLTEIE